MIFSTKVKIEIEELGKVWDVTYRKITKKDDKKIKDFAKKRIDEEINKSKELDSLREQLAEDPKNDDISKKIENIELSSMDYYQNEIDEYAFKLLVDGYDDEFIEIISQYPDGFTMALAEVKDSFAEVVAGKRKK